MEKKGPGIKRDFTYIPYAEGDNPISDVSRTVIQGVLSRMLREEEKMHYFGTREVSDDQYNYLSKIAKSKQILGKDRDNLLRWITTGWPRLKIHKKNFLGKSVDVNEDLG